MKIIHFFAKCHDQYFVQRMHVHSANFSYFFFFLVSESGELYNRFLARYSLLHSQPFPLFSSRVLVNHLLVKMEGRVAQLMKSSNTNVTVHLPSLEITVSKKSVGKNKICFKAAAAEIPQILLYVHTRCHTEFIMMIFL